jgi:effector-binding domain-containing protein
LVIASKLDFVLMKTLRRILICLLGLFLTIWLIGYFLPRQIFVERHRLIKVPSEIIFDQVNNLRNWCAWSPWLKADSAMKIIFSGTQSGTGSSFEFISYDRNILDGKITILQSIQPDSILLDMDFNEYGRVAGIFRLNDADSGTMVTWILESDLGKNPVNRWFGLFVDHFVGKDLENGLASLDSLSTLLYASISQNINVLDIEPRIVLTMHDTASPGTIGNKLGLIYARISSTVRKNKLQVVGSPFAIYHYYSQQLIDFEAGLPVNKLITPGTEIISAKLPHTKAVKTTFWGSYTQTGSAYTRIENYISTNRLEIKGSPWEVYLTDPLNQPDTSKWQTDIYYPVK